MSAESISKLKFELGHVLSVDIVGYSKRLIDETMGCRASVLECASALALLVGRARGEQTQSGGAPAALQNASVTQRAAVDECKRST